MPVTAQVGTAVHYTPPKPVTIPVALDTTFALQDASQLRVLYYYKPDRGLNIIPRVTALDWEDSIDQPARSFTISLDNYQGTLDFIKEGGVVVLQCGPLPDVGWVEWFRGIVVSRSQVHTAVEASLQLMVQDSMRNLVKSNGNFHFPAGLTATQHIRYLLNRLRIPIGHLMETQKRINGFNFSGSFTDAINILLERTKKAGGFRFVPEFADGKFWLVRYTRPAWAYQVGDVISSISRTRTIENVVTKMILHTKEHYTITVPGAPRKTTSKSSSVNTSGIPAAWLVQGKGTAGKKTSAPKPHVKKKTRTVGQTLYASDAILGAYGIIQTVVEDNQILPADLKQAAKDRMAKYTKPDDTLTIDITDAILTLRRLQMVQFDDHTITQAQGNYSVDAISGHLGADAATLSLTLSRQPTFPQAPLDAASEFGSGAGDADTVTAIVAAAKKYGIKDPAILVAVAIEESGLNPQAKGDRDASGNYTSFGLFQLHKGGLLGSMSVNDAADSTKNAEVAARAFAAAGGKTASGKQGLFLYYSKVGRGTSNTGPTERAWSVYTHAQELVAQTGKK